VPQTAENFLEEGRSTLEGKKRKDDAEEEKFFKRISYGTKTSSLFPWV